MIVEIQAKHVSQHYVIFGKRQTGRSARLVQLATQYLVQNPGQQVAVVSSSLAQADRMSELVNEKLNKEYPYLVNVRRKNRIGLWNGSAIIFSSIQSLDSIRGHRIDLVLCDDYDRYSEVSARNFRQTIAPVLATTEAGFVITVLESELPKIVAAFAGDPCALSTVTFVNVEDIAAIEGKNVGRNSI